MKQNIVSKRNNIAIAIQYLLISDINIEDILRLNPTIDVAQADLRDIQVGQVFRSVQVCPNRSTQPQGLNSQGLGM